MLHAYLLTNRAKLIDRCRHKVAQRSAPKATPVELEHGVPLFLDQLIRTLRVEQTGGRDQGWKISGAAGGRGATHGDLPSEIGDSARLHGRDLLQHGFTIDQVVHDYGDLCQAITDLAVEEGESVQVDEFRTLNRCLDNAIADAVTEFSSHRDASLAANPVTEGRALGSVIAGEMTEKLHTATVAFAALKSGKVGMTGATGGILDRSMAELKALIDGALVAATPATGPDVKRGH